MATYHIGLFHGVRGRHYRNGHKPDTLVIQARTCLDALSCEMVEYMGERVTTLSELSAKSKREEFSAPVLAEYNKRHGTHCVRIVVD